MFDLLEYLITNRDRVVSKDDILQAIWGGRIVSEFALTTRINATRAAVGDDGDQQRLIRTIPRKGIRFVGVVQERSQLEDEAPAASAVVDKETPERTAASRVKAASAERRQLTIASCELLLEQRPPEWTRRTYVRSSKAIRVVLLKRPVGTTGSSPIRMATLP